MQRECACGDYSTKTKINPSDATTWNIGLRGLERI